MYVWRSGICPSSLSLQIQTHTAVPARRVRAYQASLMTRPLAAYVLSTPYPQIWTPLLDRKFSAELALNTLCENHQHPQYLKSFNSCVYSKRACVINDLLPDAQYITSIH